MSVEIPYKTEGGEKTYVIGEALAAGGWPDPIPEGLILEDRNDPTEQITISRYSPPRIYLPAIVYFLGGGFLCLDHAILQFKPSDKQRPLWGLSPTYIELDPIDDNGTFKLLSLLTYGRYRTQLCNATGKLDPFW